MLVAGTVDLVDGLHLLLELLEQGTWGRRARLERMVLSYGLRERQRFLPSLLEG